jgi:hypothetical protein
VWVPEDNLFSFTGARIGLPDLIMSTELLATFEIALTIVAPLLALYLRGRWPLPVVVACLLALPILWYLTYSPLHELSHVIGTYAVGGTVTSVKLIPRFWAGEFARAWITTEGVTASWQQLVMTAFPYALDVACIGISYVVLQGRFKSKPFVLGLLVLLLCLRPLFDLVCEAVAFLLGGKGDFYAMAQLVGAPVLWVLVLAAIALGCHSILRVLRVYRHA